MATNQKTRPEGSSRTGRSTATKKKNQGILGGLLGGGQKTAASQTMKSASQNRHINTSP